ncbi:sugar phosphate isomerase/epimerase family protein [Paenibacillus zeisoli]|uniref:sugar phosphate isomerase/epimerase family protein n=1 Tax=Paenibacillus zeisoli TaxID=2496267 RepID=UPI001FE6CB5A|nr:sugar phosphate isomerase/epimerase [Paenibacillus zeisoli]
MTIWDAVNETQQMDIQDQPQILTLLELPAEAARRGYQAVEICHFHFLAVDPVYLNQLKEAFQAAGVQFDTLLLDYGDITTVDPVRRESDIGYIRSWIKIASLSGAKKIRVIAGEADSSDEEAIQRSAEVLSELAEYAKSYAVEVITENFKALTSRASTCLQILERTGQGMKMITDFGNFKGSLKYAEIADTIPHSVSVHAKARYDENGVPDEDEFRRCLTAVKDQGYEGSYVLIYDGPGDMWEGLDRIKRIVRECM